MPKKPPLSMISKSTVSTISARHWIFWRQVTADAGHSGHTGDLRRRTEQLRSRLQRCQRAGQYQARHGDRRCRRAQRHPHRSAGCWQNDARQAPSDDSAQPVTTGIPRHHKDLFGRRHVATGEFTDLDAPVSVAPSHDQ